jgi:hypothetical protein
MRKSIKKILREYDELDWIESVPSLPASVKIGSPIPKEGHENVFKLEMIYPSGYKGANYFKSPDDTKSLAFDLALLELSINADVDTEVYDVANSIKNMILDDDNNLAKLFGVDLEAEEDDIIDRIVEVYIYENALTDENRLPDRYVLTYFDDAGIEHSCRVSYEIVEDVLRTL